jgi:CDP-paratose 2-epimerase
MVEGITGRAQRFVYDEQHRKGDHICYYSDLRKMTTDYPAWDITVSLEETVHQLVDGWKARGTS